MEEIQRLVGYDQLNWRSYQSISQFHPSLSRSYPSSQPPLAEEDVADAAKGTTYPSPPCCEGPNSGSRCHWRKSLPLPSDSTTPPASNVGLLQSSTRPMSFEFFLFFCTFFSSDFWTLSNLFFLLTSSTSFSSQLPHSFFLRKPQRQVFFLFFFQFLQFWHAGQFLFLFFRFS